MVIAVNTRLLIKNKLEGIGWYTYETLRRITQNNKQHQFIFIFDRIYDNEFIFGDNVTPVVIGPQARHPFLWYWWFEYSIPKILKKYNADLFLSTDGYLSLNTNIPQTLVIHDINFEHYPMDVPKLVRWYYKKYTPLFANKAKRIITVSEFSKNDIIEKYKIDGSKIDVGYNGANEIFRPTNSEDKLKTKKKYTNGFDYFLYVGSIHPRKNISRLLLAFDSFKAESKQNIKLVIVGEKMRWATGSKKLIDSLTHKNDIIFTNRLNIDELKNIYGSALALTYVPYFEGFGIPIAEAMHAEIPIITSNVTSMPEIAGNAALFVDPFSIESIKNAMIKISNDEQLRNSLLKNGNERKKLFNWDNTATQLWNSIEKSLP